MLVDSLLELGIDSIRTREPGGAPGAEAIRPLLVSGGSRRWGGLTEALLHYAARLEHMDKTINPALALGTWVISDRFSDSTMAYQGHGQGLNGDVIARLHKLVLGTFQPDLTLVLDIPAEIGLNRELPSTGGSDESRYGRMGLEFHQLVLTGQ